jgi:Spy/CpxP family protein refolding chaperone
MKDTIRPQPERFVMKSRVLQVLLGIGLMASPAFAGASAQSQESRRTETIKYFLAHSLGFAPIFNLYHHSPGWILRRQKQLKLTDQQIIEEKAFKRGMQKDTHAGIAALRKAYKTYSKDAARPNPSIALIRKDIDTVGRDETRLGFEMVPYHLKGYEILTPAQQAIYAKLEAKFVQSLSLSMYNTSFEAQH